MSTQRDALLEKIRLFDEKVVAPLAAIRAARAEFQALVAEFNELEDSEQNQSDELYEGLSDTAYSLNIHLEREYHGKKVYAWEASAANC